MSEEIYENETELYKDLFLLNNLKENLEGVMSYESIIIYGKAIDRIIKYCKREVSTIPKDKIKNKILEWDKSIKWNNADDHYHAIKILNDLLLEV